MKILDALMGRRKPTRNNLDDLFALPTAAITLQTAANFVPTGSGAVCFRQAEGPAFAAAESEIVAVLDNDEDPDLERHVDDYGFTWLVSRQEDPSALVTDLHAVNTALEAQGFGPSLLCSLISFRDPSGRSLALVYLYKQGTFYPFAPKSDGRTRNNLLELQVRDLVKTDLHIEPDLQRWMPVWGAPGL
ncbi:PspA-associated protein PspAB [Nocardioides mesophilus]|uniref:Uncharacterized protein n=1 Tax=Nocardioides mesophilus TaxID=433659 RepID=A0A7G9RC73_9ACTN|nr:hypothetical protein [Nocardioides mesophilus]QNN53198.1 hypothetical protein H9L09_01515 [Nocardioides mesophilus]